MADGWLLTVGRDGRVLDANRAAKRVLGEVKGRRCCDLIAVVDGAGRSPCAATCAGGLIDGAKPSDVHGRVGRRRTGRVVCDVVGDVVVVSVLGVGSDVEPTKPLSPRERLVLAEVAAGRTNPEIGRRLGIRPATVRTHLENARDKLGVSTRAEAVAHAIALGEIQLGDWAI